MSIAHVCTGGFGNGTFLGQIRQVVVDGFFDSAVAPIQVTRFINLAAAFDSDSHAFSFASYFTGETSYSISPAVEAGWNFDTGTGTLTIDTDAAGLFGPYVVRALNASGNTDGEAFYVNVADAEFRSGGWIGIRLGLRL